MITVATYLQHYLEQTYTVADILYVYLGPNISQYDLPKATTFRAEYQYLPEFNQLDDSFIVDLQVAPGDVTTAFRDAPAEEFLLVNVPIQLAVNDIEDDLFEELQEMVEAGTIEVLDEVVSQEESSCKSSKSQAPPTCQIYLMRPSFGLQRQAYYSHLPWFVQYQVACCICYESLCIAK